MNFIGLLILVMGLALNIGLVNNTLVQLGADHFWQAVILGVFVGYLIYRRKIQRGCILNPEGVVMGGMGVVSGIFGLPVLIGMLPEGLSDPKAIEVMRWFVTVSAFLGGICISCFAMGDKKDTDAAEQEIIKTS